MSKQRLPVHRLELRVHELAQLFNSMDPTPFLNKDLDRSAEAYIENWALGFPSNSRLHLTVHFEHAIPGTEPALLVAEAIHNYFAYKADQVRIELRQLLRQGRISLWIGLAFVAACLFAAETIKQLGTGPGYAIAREGLTIIGWVALWRPVQIFLYDWWPLLRRIHVCNNLRYARIEALQGAKTM